MSSFDGFVPSRNPFKTGNYLTFLTETVMKGRLSFLHIPQRSDGRKDGPLCAACPNHRGSRESYPMSIQSFTRLFTGERSNNAQKGTLFITP